MEHLIHEIPPADQVYNQTHLLVENIKYAPSGAIILRGRLGTKDDDGTFHRAGGISPVRAVIDSPRSDGLPEERLERRGKLERMGVPHGAPAKAQDVMRTFEDSILAYFDREGWSNFWNL